MSGSGSGVADRGGCVVSGCARSCWLGDGPARRPGRRTTAARPARRRRGFRDCGALLSAVVAQLWPYLGPRLARAGADIDVAAPFLVVEAVRIRQGGRHLHAGEKLREVEVGAEACDVDGPGMTATI